MVGSDGNFKTVIFDPEKLAVAVLAAAVMAFTVTFTAMISVVIDMMAAPVASMVSVAVIVFEALDPMTGAILFVFEDAALFP